ncbi:hypothetical protein YC2023_025109 [Brassica napus]
MGSSSQRSVSEGERRLPKESSSDTVVAANLGMGSITYRFLFSATITSTTPRLRGTGTMFLVF